MTDLAAITDPSERYHAVAGWLHENVPSDSALYLGNTDSAAQHLRVDPRWAWWCANRDRVAVTARAMAVSSGRSFDGAVCDVVDIALAYGAGEGR